mgnify:CR=1 FL=1
MIFKTTVKQHRDESYWDAEKQKKVDYDISDEIHGIFSDWEQVESFVNNLLSGFPNIEVEIKIIKEV